MILVELTHTRTRTHTHTHTHIHTHIHTVHIHTHTHTPSRSVHPSAYSTVWSRHRICITMSSPCQALTHAREQQQQQQKTKDGLGIYILAFVDQIPYLHVEGPIGAYQVLTRRFFYPSFQHCNSTRGPTRNRESFLSQTLIGSTAATTAATTTAATATAATAVYLI